MPTTQRHVKLAMVEASSSKLALAITSSFIAGFSEGKQKKNVFSRDKR